MHVLQPDVRIGGVGRRGRGGRTVTGASRRGREGSSAGAGALREGAARRARRREQGASGLLASAAGCESRADALYPPPMSRPFLKMNGLGNDFVVVEARPRAPTAHSRPRWRRRAPCLLFLCSSAGSRLALSAAKTCFHSRWRASPMRHAEKKRKSTRSAERGRKMGCDGLDLLAREEPLADARGVLRRLLDVGTRALADEPLPNGELKGGQATPARCGASHRPLLQRAVPRRSRAESRSSASGSHHGRCR